MDSEKIIYLKKILKKSTYIKLLLSQWNSPTLYSIEKKLQFTFSEFVHFQLSLFFN